VQSSDSDPVEPPLPAVLTSQLSARLKQVIVADVQDAKVEACSEGVCQKDDRLTSQVAEAMAAVPKDYVTVETYSSNGCAGASVTRQPHLAGACVNGYRYSCVDGKAVRRVYSDSSCATEIVESRGEVDSGSCLPSSAVKLSCEAKQSVVIKDFTNSVCSSGEISNDRVKDFCYQTAASTSSMTMVASGELKVYVYDSGDCSGPSQVVTSLTCGSCEDPEGDLSYHMAMCPVPYSDPELPIDPQTDAAQLNQAPLLLFLLLPLFVAAA